jgi:23S rRNA (guanosine2251-2'-O)-methyltransferase
MKAREKEDKGVFVIPGYHGVREALEAGTSRIGEIRIIKGRGSPREKEIIVLARERGIPVVSMDQRAFEELAPGLSHQGFAAVAKEFWYSELEDMAERAAAGPAKGLLVAADHITDEGNLGAIIRSAAFFNAHGLIIPRDRSAAVTPLVFKRSSGGCVHLPVARVVNLERSLGYLKEKGFWVIGAAGDAARSVYDFDWDRHIVLVLGNEEKGLGAIVRKRCDEILAIPGSGRVRSLNVASAAAILLSLRGRPLIFHI